MVFRIVRYLLVAALIAGAGNPLHAERAPTERLVPAVKPMLPDGRAIGARVAAPPGKLNGPGHQVALTLTKAQQFTTAVDVRDVLIADPAVADVLIKTPRMVYLIGNKIGDTNAIFLDAAGRQVLRLDIRVDRDLTALRSAISELVPDADVTVASLNQDLVISGDVPSAQIADSVRGLVRRFVEKDENLVNMMKVTGSQQVVIRLKIAEVRRTVTKRLGFNLFLQGDSFAVGAGGTNGTDLFQDKYGMISSIGRTFNNQNGVRTPVAGLTSFANAAQASQVLTTVEALEQQGLIKMLAEPNLTAISGEPASFLAGGEFPVPGGRDSTGNISIEYKQFGVSLNFTPVVLSNGRLNLRIATEVSELDNTIALRLANVLIPGLQVRRAQTTVEVPSGGSLVLGGLLRNDARNTQRGLPGLKDLPILGTLFRSNDFLSNETELVVIATPYVVRAGAPSAMAAPTDGFAPASDINMYLLNGLYARYGGGSKSDAEAGSAGEGPAKSFGYIMP